MFHIGQKVVCVEDGEVIIQGFRSAGNLDGLTKGSIYTIRWFEYEDWPLLNIFKLPCVKLEKIVRIPGLIHATNMMAYEDMPFWAGRFVPLKKKQTSIAVFQEMLVKTPEMADV